MKCPEKFRVLWGGQPLIDLPCEKTVTHSVVHVVKLKDHRGIEALVVWNIPEEEE